MRLVVKAFVSVGVCGLASAASAQVQSGFVQDFASGVGGFAGGANTVTNPGTDGVGGVGDGFLSVSRSFEGPLAVRSLLDEYSGDWLDAGVTGVDVWVRDIGQVDAGLEIRVGIGNDANFWVSDVGLAATTEWEMLSVRFDQGWTQVIGVGSFEEALQTTDRLQFRHEPLPIDDFGPSADPIIGDVGFDRIVLVPGPGAIGLAGVLGLVSGRRR